MPTLHTLSTLRTPADGNVKTPYPRPAHDLFLILRLDPLQRQGAGARRTLRRNRYWNLLIHTVWHRPTVMLSVAGTRFAAWRLRMTLAQAPRKRGRLTPGRPLCTLQLLLQPPNLFPQPGILAL